MKSVKFYGHLAEDFGAEHKVSVSNVRQLFRLFEANNPGKFLKSLVGNEYHVVLTDKNGKRSTDLGTNPEMGLYMGLESGVTIHVMPAGDAAGGSKGKGFLQILLGVVLIAAAFMTAGGAFGALMAGNFSGAGALLANASVLGMVSASSVALMGLGLVIGGISTLITPTPKLSDYGDRGEKDQRQSALFNGPVNTVEQGGPMPVVYGEVWCGTIVLSSALQIERVAIQEAGGSGSGEGGSGAGGSGFPVLTENGIEFMPWSDINAQNEAFWAARGFTLFRTSSN